MSPLASGKDSKRSDEESLLALGTVFVSETEGKVKPLVYIDPQVSGVIDG